MTIEIIGQYDLGGVAARNLILHFPEIGGILIFLELFDTLQTRPKILISVNRNFIQDFGL